MSLNNIPEANLYRDPTAADNLRSDNGKNGGLDCL